MTTVRVDGNKHSGFENQDGNLQELLVQIADEISKDHRVIINVLVDGEQYQSLSDPRLTELRIGSVRSLDVETANPRSLSIQILYESAKYVGLIADELGLIAEKLQTRQEESAFQRLQEALHSWMEINQGLTNAIKALGLNLDELVVGNKTLGRLQQEICSSLDEAGATLEQQDYLGLSDLLEYGMAPKLKEMQEGLYRLINLAEKKLH